jgi:hypothetical protein
VRPAGLVTAAGSATSSIPGRCSALAVVLQASGSHTSAPRLIGPMVLIGLGNGLAIPVLTGVMLAGAHAVQAGAAAGVLTTGQQFSSTAGVTVIGTVFFTILGTRADVAGFAHSLVWVLVIGMILLLIAGVSRT